MLTCLHRAKGEMEYESENEVSIEALRAVAANGYAVLDSHSTEGFLKIAQELGRPIASRRGIDVVQTLQVSDEECAYANSLSSRYGAGKFPLHTDLAYWQVPARYVLLRAPDESSSTCPTLLLDFRAHLKGQPFESALGKTLYLVANGRKSFLTTIGGRVASGAVLLRFDRDCLRPTNRQSMATLDELEASLAACKIIEMAWSAHKVLIIDNWRMLHGRGDARDSNDRKRVLERILVTEAKGFEPWD